MFRRASAVTAVLVAVAIVASGCAGTPAPVETTAALTEEEAFAAAEETYRAYVDALNRVDLSDPETFEPVYALTTGELNASDRENFSAWHAEGISIVGEATVEEVLPAEFNTDVVVIEACYNIANVDVLGVNGVSIVEDSRPSVQALRITELIDSGSDLRLSTINSAEVIECGK